MEQTRQAHLCALINSGCGFKAAVLLTALYFKVPEWIIEQEFYR
jgi:hypothetical protein